MEASAPFLYRTLVSVFLAPYTRRTLPWRRWKCVTDQVTPMTMRSATMRETREVMSTGSRMSTIIQV